MSELIIYLLKVMAVHGLMFSFYWTFLKRSVFHKYNRYYLLSAIFLAFIIPFISIPISENVPQIIQESPVIYWFSEPVMAPQELAWIPVKATETFSYWSLLPLLYGSVSAGLLIRSLLYLSVLRRLKRHSEPVHKDWFTLFKTSQTRPFSFFFSVFMPKALFGTNLYEQVLAHECVHVRQFHSLDRLLLDFFVSLFWFNPFIYLYRNALIEIHEYQADEGVLKEFNDLIAYQEVLFSQLQSPQYSGLVSHFNFQMIKKRIVMMNKQKKRTGWRYFLTFPVMLVVIFAFSSKEVMQPLKEVGDEISSIIGPIGDVKSYAESITGQTNTPSILPFTNTENIRMTSGFEMRMHPVEKVHKMHLGMDFGCAIGTRIIATGDGIVMKIQEKSGGYGKMVVIDHGNGFITKYAQLSEIKVAVGDHVKQGQVIALSGNSGASTGPHLHYEVLENGKQVNPALYIKNYTFAIHEEKPAVDEKKEFSPGGTKQDQSNIPSILPLGTTDNMKVKSGFGMQMHPILKVEKMHTGLDFKCPEGTPVLVTADGMVKQVESAFNGYGKHILIDHGNGYVTQYAHLSRFNVELEQKVRRGEVIGYSGNTGASTAPHLHYEVRKEGRKVNPAFYITNYEFSTAYLKENVAPHKMKHNAEVNAEPKNGPDAPSRMDYLTLSIVDGNDPLYVLDGVVIKSDELSHINPDDIVSVRVLKDEDARDKYGEMGEYGVVEIQTKSNTKVKKKVKVKDRKTKEADKKRRDYKKKEVYRVVIDPGHGGHDDGAKSPTGSIEKEISLTIAQLIATEFESNENIEIILTRNTDHFLALEERVEKAKDADLLISLHTDNYSEQGSFILPIYNDQHHYAEESKLLAQLLADEFESIGKSTRIAYSNGYYLLKKAECPAVLLNLGWFSDPEEDMFLSSYVGRKNLAVQISQAIKQAIL